MKITVLGTGSAFEPQNVNTSFVVEMKSGFVILVDCGYNVFGELKANYPELLAKINAVCITHTHDDHIGSLQSLLFYKYYVENKCIDLISTELNESLRNIINTISYSGSSTKNIELAHFQRSDYTGIKLDSVNKFRGYIEFVSTNHIVTINTGFLFIEDDHFIFISGDTKATSKIERSVAQCIESHKLKYGVIFHDFSDWNVPSKNVHACKNDCEAEYSEYFNSSMNKVHNNDQLLVGETFDLSSDNINLNLKIHQKV